MPAHNLGKTTRLSLASRIISMELYSISKNMKNKTANYIKLSALVLLRDELVI